MSCKTLISLYVVGEWVSEGGWLGEGEARRNKEVCFVKGDRGHTHSGSRNNMYFT